MMMEGEELASLIDENRKCCKIRVEAVAFAYLVKKFDGLETFEAASNSTSNFEVDMAFSK